MLHAVDKLGFLLGQELSSESFGLLADLLILFDIVVLVHISVSFSNADHKVSGVLPA